MNEFLKVLTSAFAGSLVAWIIWLIIYLANKTPAIEFDGPAGLGMILSVIAGAAIFGIVGVILAVRK